MEEQPFDWRYQVCRIAAAFDVPRVEIISKFSCAIFHFSTGHVESRQSEDIDPRWYEVGAYEAFLIRWADNSHFGAAMGYLDKRNGPRLAELTAFLRFRLLDLDTETREAAHAQWYGVSLPLWTQHELIEAHLSYRERLAHHLATSYPECGAA